jgi:hypothetical protein
VGYAANRDHGLRRTNGDKKRAVLSSLKHPNGAKKPNSEIARHVGVSVPTVSKYRNSKHL